MSQYKLSKRVEIGTAGVLLQAAVAITMAFLASGILLAILGFDPWEALDALRIGAMGDWESVQGSMVHAAPLAFTGLAASFAFRARIWSIGQEGQFFAGAMMAYFFTTIVQLPAILMVPLVILAGMLGGSLIGGLCGVLKSRFDVNIIVSTVMLNYIIVYLLSYLLTSRIWMAPGEYYVQSARVPKSSHLPDMFANTDLHIGVGLAILTVLAMHFVVNRTTFGFGLRAFGDNQVAARFKGINPKRMTVIVMLISGALAGLGGMVQTFGVDFRVSQTFLTGYGSAGLIIAVIAGLRPLSVGLVALLFGGLANGGLFMQVMADVSSAIISAMQAIILMFFLITSVLFQYRIKRVTSDD
ncbi:ABC transporter permease [Ruegeria sp. Ofav3-42]|uniref:ABC transporter permease n=1 Tax=Ruegeria sp. Ofav3-42 TaxID=2917759 RepID=UPI001EF4BC9A|nr:ABC transporter permease [Ruegeria sp. Ofav3-42]MCG7522546.1 ABC transporter permease [Ruegeria sp. Ofav3-42]